MSMIDLRTNVRPADSLAPEKFNMAYVRELIENRKWDHECINFLTRLGDRDQFEQWAQLCFSDVPQIWNVAGAINVKSSWERYCGVDGSNRPNYRLSLAIIYAPFWNPPPLQPRHQNSPTTWRVDKGDPRNNNSYYTWEAFWMRKALEYIPDEFIDEICLLRSSTRDSLDLAGLLVVRNLATYNPNMRIITNSEYREACEAINRHLGG
jgi:hypothetical protein